MLQGSLDYFSTTFESLLDYFLITFEVLLIYFCIIFRPRKLLRLGMSTHGVCVADNFVSMGGWWAAYCSVGCVVPLTLHF